MQLGKALRNVSFGAAPPKFNGGRRGGLTNTIEYDPFSVGHHRRIGGLPLQPLQLHPFRTHDDSINLAHEVDDNRVAGSIGPKGELGFDAPPAVEPSTSWYSARPFLPVIVTKTSLGVGFEGEEIEVRTDYYNYNNDVLILATPETRKRFHNWRGVSVERSPSLLSELGRKRMYFDFWWALFAARPSFRRPYVGLRTRTDRQPFTPTLLEPITKRDIATELWDKQRIIVDPKRLFFYPSEEEVVWRPHKFGVWYVFPEGAGDGCEDAVMDTEKVRIECNQSWDELKSPFWTGGYTSAPHDLPLQNTSFTQHETDDWKEHKGPRDGDHLSLAMYRRGRNAYSRHEMCNIAGHSRPSQYGRNTIFPDGLMTPARRRSVA